MASERFKHSRTLTWVELRPLTTALRFARTALVVREADAACRRRRIPLFVVARAAVVTQCASHLTQLLARRMARVVVRETASGREFVGKSWDILVRPFRAGFTDNAFWFRPQSSKSACKKGKEMIYLVTQWTLFNLMFPSERLVYI